MKRTSLGGEFTAILEEKEQLSCKEATMCSRHELLAGEPVGPILWEERGSVSIIKEGRAQAQMDRRHAAGHWEERAQPPFPSSLPPTPAELPPPTPTSLRSFSQMH